MILTGKIFKKSLDGRSAGQKDPWTSMEASSGAGANAKRNRRGYTLIELLLVVLLISIPVATGRISAEKYGTWGGIGAALLSIPPAVLLVVLVYRALVRIHERRQRRFRETYLYVYRVLEPPGDPRKILKPSSAELLAGDYGWEAHPLRRDGLVYLQGLTADWRVVWYAGFRPDQIEPVARKPVSQYDWRSWLPNPPLCPYPVKDRPSATMGYPW